MSENNTQENGSKLLQDVIRNVFEELKNSDFIRYGTDHFLEDLLLCSDFRELFRLNSNLWVGLDDMFTHSDICDEFGFQVLVYLTPDNDIVLFMKEEGYNDEEEYDEEEDSETHESIWNDEDED